MSRNFRIFAFAAVIFWIVGAMNDARVMYVLAGVCAAIMLIAWLLSQLALSRLELTLSSPAGNAAAGSELPCTVQVRSHGGITLGSTEVELTAENLTVEGVSVSRRVLLPPMPPGAELHLQMSLRPPLRGRYRLGPPRIIDSDPIGMFEQRRAMGTCSEVVVFPRTWDLPRVAAWDTGPGWYSARGRDIRRDHGEFRGIREHTPGDDLRHVHWKVSAHVGELAVKEYEPMRHDLISIHLDLAADHHYGEGPTGTLETAISAAASLTRAALAEQRSVGLHGQGLPTSLGRPGVGQPQLLRIMVALAEARTVDEQGFSAALGRQFRALPRGASVFIITTGGEPEILEVLSSGAATAGSVTLLVVCCPEEDTPEELRFTPRKLVESARSTGMAAALLRSPADIAEAVVSASTVAARAPTGAM